ncbi:MAG: YifB family Mg chelatase-like AAA ATPase [Candidatus Gracilibacteria bacterium]|nr:YifB family Mg chelatase-like AAA ATPase [Candidatus Gracilibacteria bacterium]
MITKVNSITVNGLDSHLVEVEVDINNGLPSFTIVGLPDQGVQESKERLRSAMKSSGNKLPMTRITVNLAPADIRKSGPSFDFPIAVGIMLNEGFIEDTFVSDSIFLGELSLDGRLRKVASVLPATIGAKEKGFKRIFIPKDNSLEASIVPGIDVIAVENLREVIDFLNSEKELLVLPELDFKKLGKDDISNNFDFKYVLGQEHAKRALEISASGGHNIIMDGPPGSGKTMLSKAFSSILPDLTIDESIEVSKIYSISGLLNAQNPIVRKRPFRTIHHTASSVSIVGGGRNAKPGEISLSHKGVLFLDEILEFEKSVLEVLRQPLEDGNITINRANASYSYPAQFIMIGAMNPCPCGYFTDPDRDCICSHKQVENYRSKLSGPLIDRVDIFIEVPKVKTDKFKVGEDYSKSETSSDIKKRVEKARQKQLIRFKGTDLTFNSEMGTNEINKYCQLDKNTEMILKQAVNNMNLSARAYYRIIKLARTIADLDGLKDIESKHILEALSFRKKEEN